MQPALGGVNYDPATLRALASLDGVVAIKEASFDARRFIEVARLLEVLERPITLLTGNEQLHLRVVRPRRAGGVDRFRRDHDAGAGPDDQAWKAGRFEEATALARRVQRLADVIFAAPVGNYRVRLKEALCMLGVLDTAYVREPLLPISDDERALVRRTLQEVGLSAAVAA